MSAFLSFVVLLPAIHAGLPVTLPTPYADVDACAQGRKAAIAEFVEGTPFPYKIVGVTCGLANDSGSTEQRAPLHLRDLKPPTPENSI